MTAWVGINMKMPKMLLSLEKELAKATERNHMLEVGWFDKENAEIATVNEYGAVRPITAANRAEFSAAGIELGNTAKTITIPPRPHRQQTITKNKNHWKNILSVALTKTNFDVDTSLNILGIEMQQNYKDMIKSGEFVRNSPITLAIRKQKGIGSTIPLYATGEWERALTYEVSNG